MTLLEFVCDNLIGPPVSRCGDRSTYHCPRHKDNHPSLTTFPHKPEYKDRFKCWSCNFRGDVFDLLREFFPDENFGQHQIRLDAFRDDFEGELKSRTIERHSPSSIRGGGRKTPTRTKNAYDRDPMDDEFSPEASSAIALLLEQIKKMPTDYQYRDLLLAQTTLEICAQHGLHPAGFAVRCGFQIWSRESLKQHAAECNDPHCGDECRAARGLPPLTKAEIEARRREAEEFQRRRAERVH